MGDIVNLNNDVTYVDLDPKEMIKNAMEEYDFSEVVLVGWLDQGAGKEKMILCTSSGSTPRIVYSLELAKASILESTLE